MGYTASFIVRLITRGLGAGYPIRLTVGAIAGLLAKNVVHVLFINIPFSASLKYIDGLHDAYYSVVGAALAFAPLIVGKRGVPEAVVQNIRAIEAMLDHADLPR